MLCLPCRIDFRVDFFGRETIQSWPVCTLAEDCCSHSGAEENASCGYVSILRAGCPLCCRRQFTEP